MKQRWIQLALKIDALSLRERVMVFAAVAGVVLFLAFFAFLDPLYLQKNALTTRIVQQQNQINGINAEMVQKIQAFGVDPDLASRNRLQQIRTESAAFNAQLRAIEKGLVQPDKMVALLQTLLRSNGKLRLVSLTTVPAVGLSDAGFVDAVKDEAGAAPQGPVNPAAAATAALLGQPAPPGQPALPGQPAKAAAVAKTAPLLFRHGVEVVLQGSYLDMVSYMEALEGGKSQLFWGKAVLNANAYPNASLTLTLYTLSLDQKWIAL